jgi:GDPmannose 4,6-dehydratase
VEAMWRTLQQDAPDDYVVATGTSCSVRDFVGHCFAHVGLDWRDHVRFDDRYLRPSEVDDLVGDASKAESVLGWRPTVFAPDLARLMVDAELEGLQRTAAGQAGGQPVLATR